MSEFVQQIFEEDEQQQRLADLRDALILPWPRAVARMRSTIGSHSEIKGITTDIELEEYFNAFESETKINVSPTAQALIKTILTAILEDPHPQWNLPLLKRRMMVRFFVVHLTSYLYRIIKEEHVRGNITTFDILHWLAINLGILCAVPNKN